LESGGKGFGLVIKSLQQGVELGHVRMFQELKAAAA